MAQASGMITISHLAGSGEHAPPEKFLPESASEAFYMHVSTFETE